MPESKLFQLSGAQKRRIAMDCKEPAGRKTNIVNSSVPKTGYFSNPWRQSRQMDQRNGKIDMIMELAFRCRYLSVLQVIVIVTCHRVEVSNSPHIDPEQGCVGSQLNLRCPEMKVIQITYVVLGDSSCSGTWCCIKHNDCTYTANANHRAEVRRRCDYKRNCTVGVIKEEIPCGYWGFWFNNDFERITYNCIDDTQNHTMNSSYDEASTEDNNNTAVDKRDFGLKIAQSCVGSQFSVKCEEMKVIKVKHVALGYSNGTGTVCNISDNNCIRNASANHTMDVHHRCDGQRTCSVDVLKEKINCGWLDSDSWSNNDFELIAYNCLNDSRVTSTTESGITNSNMLTIGIVIACIIILLIIILLVVVMYRRKKRSQTTTRLDPVDNCQNEYDIYANETQGASTHGDGYAQTMYSAIEESDSPKRDKNQIIYSEVELMETISKDRQTTGQTKAAAVKSSAQLDAGIISKSHSPEDDGCQTVIENDLYGMADNCAKDTTVESPTRSLSGAVSKHPSSQDEEGLTVIENDIYCH